MMLGPRRARAAAVGLLLLLSGLSGCSGTTGETTGLSGRIEGVQPSDGGVDVHFYATELPLDAQLQAERVSVLVDGEPVGASAAAPDQGDLHADLRRVMLVIDNSGSMEGGRLEAARSAAAAYLDQVPPDVDVGLTTFADVPAVAVAPTRDRDAVRAVLPRLVAANGTSLYDAVVVSAEALGSVGERRLVVLSDGADTSSGRTLEAAAAAVQGSRTQLDSVALGVEDAAMPAVRRLTQAGRGQVLRAEDALEATVAFKEAAGVFSKRLRIHVPVAEELAGRDASLHVQVGSSAGPVSAQGTLTLPGSRPPGFWDSGTALAAGLGALLTGLVGLLVLVVGTGPSRTEQRQRSKDLLEGYTLRAEPGQGSSAVQDDLRWQHVPGARVAVDLVEKVVHGRGLSERLALRLDRAAVALTPGEWLLLHAGSVLLVGAVTLLLGGLLLALLATSVVGAGLHAGLALKARRRTDAFTAAMPDALQLIASGLATGYSLPQALDAAVREGQEPIAGELGRALAEARLGVPLEDALDTVAERMDSKDFHWVVMAIRVQRGVGGNLSEVLGTVCATMRDRANLRRQVAAISAEGRLSAIVLIGLPIFMGLFQLLFRRAYFEPMLTRPIGLVLLVASGLSLALGALVMKKIVKVEM